MNRYVVWFAIILIAAVGGYYCYKNWDSIKANTQSILGLNNTQSFRIVGSSVGSYTTGDMVIAENNTFKKRDPRIGEVVVYQKEVNGQDVDSVGLVIGLPGQSNGSGSFIPSGYYQVQKDQTELVPRDKIIWLVIRKAI